MRTKPYTPNDKNLITDFNLENGSNFAQVSLPFGRIRDLRLYRNEFDTFETYCRDKWQYGHRYVDRLIAAAKLVTDLGTTRPQTKPEHETQVRPLIGLNSDEASAAWDHAVEMEVALNFRSESSGL